MATISRSFEANQTATQLTSITNTEQFFDSIPLLDVYEGCVVQIDIDFVVSPTDDMVVSIYVRQDGTNYDIVPFLQFTVDKGTDPSRISFVIRDVYEFRVGVKASGATDTHTSADMDSRRWRWSSA